jgi:hypothetical protein
VVLLLLVGHALKKGGQTNPWVLGLAGRVRGSRWLGCSRFTRPGRGKTKRERNKRGKWSILRKLTCSHFVYFMQITSLLETMRALVLSVEGCTSFH